MSTRRTRTRTAPTPRLTELEPRTVPAFVPNAVNLNDGQVFIAGGDGNDDIRVSRWSAAATYLILINGRQWEVPESYPHVFRVRLGSGDDHFEMNPADGIAVNVEADGNAGNDTL